MGGHVGPYALQQPDQPAASSSAVLSASSTLQSSVTSTPSLVPSSSQRFLSSTGTPLLGTFTLSTKSASSAMLLSSSVTSPATPTATLSSQGSASLSARSLSHAAIPSSAASSRVTSSVISSKVPSSTPSATAAASYIDLGCWYDNGTDRTFTGPSFTNSKTMTNEVCATYCSNHGMPFSGTEYGEECYCSDVPPASYAAWWCDMPCSGNSTEICGSGDALSVLYSATPAPESTEKVNLGCFGDAVVQRTMTGPSFSSSSMTNEICSSFCFSQGYSYSGTEYGDQCYCDDSAPWSSSVGCSMPCAGNSTEICGDGDALAVTYTSNGTVTDVSSTANNTTATKTHPTVDLNAKFSSWSTWKARGVNLGNWLVLEQWMYSSWFDAAAPGAVDEWTFCQSLGSDCASVLQTHWQSWVVESDIAEIAGANTNTLRIPVGFWAFIDPLPSEPYIRSTQLDELSRILGYAQTYGMTVIVDIHGLPGSQNGQEHSGHAGSIEFYSAENQARSLATVQAAATWIANSGFAGTTVSALEVANEPAIANWEVWLQYKNYVVQAHEIVQSTVPSVATMFHDGFWDLSPWNQFFSSSDNQSSTPTSTGHSRRLRWLKPTRTCAPTSGSSTLSTCQSSLASFLFQWMPQGPRPPASPLGSSKARCRSGYSTLVPRSGVSRYSTPMASRRIRPGQRRESSRAACSTTTCGTFPTRLAEERASRHRKYVDRSCTFDQLYIYAYRYEQKEFVATRLCHCRRI